MVQPLRMVAGAVALLTVAACTSEPAADDRPSSTPSASPTASSAAPESPAPGGEPTGEAGGEAGGEPGGEARLTAPPNPVSLPALFEKKYDGGRLRSRDVIARTDAYTSYSVTYRSNGLRISGKLDVPQGNGPFPALVLAHGYIDPAIYVNGQGMRREQDWLARAGFVVLHTDYRNHSFSSRDPSSDRRMRLGYTVDAINAVHALRRTRMAPVDDERIGIVGRSMGGGVVYNVLTAQPGLVDAAVVFAPVSSRTADNFNRWIRDDPGRSATADFILRRYGEPSENARFWREVSPRPYFDRITEPLMIHHGTADESCPIRWSRASYRALKEASVDARMHVYPGEPHAFVADWPLSMRRTTKFLRQAL